MQDRVQNYAKVAKDLFSSVAKLAVTQATEQFASHQLVQTSTSPNARASVPLESRVSRFKQQLLASRIDLHELRRLSMQGIPDKDGLRAITWKVGRPTCQHRFHRCSCCVRRTRSSSSSSMVWSVCDVCQDTVTCPFGLHLGVGSMLRSQLQHPPTSCSLTAAQQCSEYAHLWSATPPCPMQLLLGYLPPNPDDWDEALARSRTQYLMFCQVGPVSDHDGYTVPARGLTSFNVQLQHCVSHTHW